MPRVISGTAGGIFLQVPKGRNTRPTGDRAKEALFSILTPYIRDGNAVLDLFAGSGGMGIESMSRGIPRGVFVDQSFESRKVILRNLEACNLTSRACIMGGDARRAVESLGRQELRFCLVFLDPPYGQGLLIPCIEKIVSCDIMTEMGILVAEHGKQEQPADIIGCLEAWERRMYGEIKFTFYRKWRKQD